MRLLNFLAIPEREASAQIEEELTWASCVEVFLAARFKTTGGMILVAFWPKHGLRSDLRVPGGACPQTPLASSHRNGRTGLKWLAPALILEEGAALCWI